MLAFFSPYMGNCQRLSNGNTRISESAFERMFEVNQEGEIVLKYLSPYFGENEDAKTRRLHPGDSNTVYRAHRYSLEEIPWLKQTLIKQS